MKYLLLILLFASNVLAQGFHLEMNARSTELLEEDIRQIQAMGFKYLRFQIFTGFAEEQQKYINSVMQQLERIEYLQHPVRMWYILDLHDCPDNYEVCLIAAEEIYKKFDKYYYFVGVEFNEPKLNRKDNNYYAQRLVSMANRVAPTKSAIVQSRRGSPDTLFELPKLIGHNIIYSVHIYQEYDITHHCVNYFGLTGFPSKVKKFENSELSKDIKTIARFKKERRASVWITEFAAARCSGYPKYEHRPKWVGEAVSYFSKHDLIWFYLDYRANDIWSVRKSWNPYDKHEYQSTQTLDILKSSINK